MRFSLALIAALCVLPRPLLAEEIDYAREIKPLLKARCYACHGALKQKARLRLDAGALIKKGGRSGPAVTAGHAADSLLLERVSAADAEMRMPPEGKPLTQPQIAALRAWIDQGAKTPAGERPEEDPRKHWAFQRPIRPAVPNPGRAGWNRNPIDAFVAAVHEREGLIPNPPAEKQVWLRRVYLDLIGLPPTPEQLQGFLADQSMDAYEKVVDRLLGSPQYGERWGRHWMDVWRYSDWYGARQNNDNRNSYGQIWRWRDWIIRSLNEDKGYDRMVLEMLAADEIAPEDDANLVATGYLVRNWFKWNYDVWKKDLVEHTAKAFLGLTLNCAFCHDHKYDPISQEEYFRFRAFFEPLEIRQDRVPGEPDPGPYKKYVYGSTSVPMASGMVRSTDEFFDLPTYMFKLGDSRNRFEGKPPVPAGAPACIGGDRLRIEPVSLSPVAFYPGLKPFVQEEEISRRAKLVRPARTEVIAALERLTAAHARLAALETGKQNESLSPPGLKAQIELTEAKKLLQRCEAKLATAEAELRAIQARVAADKARYQHSTGNIDELARIASKAERSLALCHAREKLLLAEHGVTKQPIDQAKQEVAAAEKALTAESTVYAPLSPIYPQRSTGRRAALARWLANKDNPLAARVAVNHLWGRHFGKPLVETTFNLGRSGKRPSHPELLDWLAVEFMENGWSMKHLHRLIVTSNAYRMSSNQGRDNPNAARDRDHRLLWRFPPSRLQAEEVRDSLLLVAGNLDPTIGGPDIDHTQGQFSHRRSLYFTHHAEAKMEFLEMFDGANACECYTRTVSILPQQALALTNSDLTRAQACLLASKLWGQVKPGKPGPEVQEVAFVRMAFTQILGREPTAGEQAATRAFLHQQAGSLQGAAGPAAAGARAREDFVQALFSHNDFVTVR